MKPLTSYEPWKVVLCGFCAGLAATGILLVLAVYVLSRLQ